MDFFFFCRSKRRQNTIADVIHQQPRLVARRRVDFCRLFVRSTQLAPLPTPKAKVKSRYCLGIGLAQPAIFTLVGLHFIYASR